MGQRAASAPRNPPPHRRWKRATSATQPSSPVDCLVIIVRAGHWGLAVPYDERRIGQVRPVPARAAPTDRFHWTAMSWAGGSQFSQRNRLRATARVCPFANNHSVTVVALFGAGPRGHPVSKPFSRFDRQPPSPAAYLGGAAGAMRTLLAAILPVRSIPNS